MEDEIRKIALGLITGAHAICGFSKDFDERKIYTLGFDEGILRMTQEMLRLVAENSDESEEENG